MIKQLALLLRPAVGSLLLALLTGSFASLSTISLMGLSAWLIASAALQPPLYVLSLAIVGVRFCGITRAVFRYLERYLAHQLAFNLFTNFRVRVLAKIIEALPFKRRSFAGDVFEIIIEAIDKIRDSFIRFFLPPLTITFICLIVMIWQGFYSFVLLSILAISWLVFLVILPIYAWNLYRKQPTFNNFLAEEVMEFYEGNSELLAYNYEHTKFTKVQTAINDYQAYRQQMFLLISKINLYSEIVRDFLIVMILIAVIYLVNQFDFNAVMAITMLLTMQSVIEILATMPSLIEHFNEAYLNWQRLKPYMYSKTHDKVANADINSSAMLTAKNLSYGYDDDNLIANDLNFALKRGAKTLLIGTSGCGKSTLFYVLTRILYPTAGEIYLQGKAYSSLSEQAIREHFAISFQDHHLFNQSVRDNFKMIYPDITDAEIIKALTSVQMDTWLNQHGLDFVLADDGSNLSGGQRHRLQLAICLARDKDIILLDEPTAGLDIMAARSFMQKLLTKYENKTMLISSHDLTLLNYFDEIIMLEAGKIVEQGNIKELLQDKNSRLAKIKKYNNFI